MISISCKNIIDYINNSFKDNDSFNNYLSLIKYLSLNDNIKIGYEDAKQILIFCPKLSKCIFDVYEDIDEKNTLDNDSFSMILDAYNNMCLSDTKCSKKDLDILQLYLDEIRQFSLLDEKEEKELGYKIMNGDLNAREKLINHNLRLVISVAKHYLNRGLPIEDLIQEGNLGLIKAAEKFNPNSNCRFSTYAFYWIKRNIYYALISKTTHIRLSPKSYEKLRKIKQVLSNTEYRIDIKEISKLTKIDEKSIIELIRADSVLSLNIDYENDSSLEDSVEDKNIEDVNDKLFYKSFIEELNNTKCISNKEKDILELYFGLKNGKKYNYVEIGKMYGVTRQRIYYIIKRSLNRLKEDPKINKYNDIYSDKDSIAKKLKKNTIMFDNMN